MIIWETIALTFQLAIITTVILMALGIPLAHWLAYSKFKAKPIIETFISMPLVLPPTVIGFYLLVVFSPNNAFGTWLKDWFDLQLVFSFEGLVVASIIYSLPFMVHPIQSAFNSFPRHLIESARLLGKSKSQILFRVLIPNITSSLLTGIVLAFTHTIGEFGVVLMIGGNIAGETKVASIAIYDEVEALNYSVANTYSGILVTFSFCILLVVYLTNRGYLKKWSP